MKIKQFVAFAFLLSSTATNAWGSVTVEPSDDAYHYVSHYSIEIDAPAETVWEQAVDIAAWMVGFELSLESGTPGQEGEVRRLYAGQDFFVQVTKVIPNEVLVFANLPTSFNGEVSTGVAVVTLDATEGGTKVRLTMSRRFSEQADSDGTQRTTRQSAEFSERDKAMWQDTFLVKLKTLSESRR